MINPRRFAGGCTLLSACQIRVHQQKLDLGEDNLSDLKSHGGHYFDMGFGGSFLFLGITVFRYIVNIHVYI